MCARQKQLAVDQLSCPRFFPVYPVLTPPVIICAIQRRSRDAIVRAQKMVIYSKTGSIVGKVEKTLLKIHRRWLSSFHSSMIVYIVPDPLIGGEAYELLVDNAIADAYGFPL